MRSHGSRGDSYDNALPEAVNGLYKAELIHRQGPWRSIEHRPQALQSTDAIRHQLGTERPTPNDFAAPSGLASRDSADLGDWILWRGQGLSDRYLCSAQARKDQLGLARTSSTGSSAVRSLSPTTGSRC